MSKKMLKRSLALGALMAFVITGSAYAETFVGSDYEVEDWHISETFTIDLKEDSVLEGGIQDENDGHIVDGKPVKDTWILNLNDKKLTSTGSIYIAGGILDINGLDGSVLDITAATGLGVEGDIDVDTLKITATNAGAYLVNLMSIDANVVDIKSDNYGFNVQGDFDNYGNPTSNGNLQLNSNTLKIESVYYALRAAHETNINIDTNEILINSAKGNKVSHNANLILKADSGTVTSDFIVEDTGNLQLTFGNGIEFNSVIGTADTATSELVLNGATWNLPKASSLTNATFNSSSKLVIDGNAFKYSDVADATNTYALNGVGTGVSLTVVDGAKIVINNGVEEGIYNVAQGFAKGAGENWTLEAENALWYADWADVDSVDDTLHATIKVKTAQDMVDTGVATNENKEIMLDIATAPAGENATADAINELASSDNVTAEDIQKGAAALLQIGEAGGFTGNVVSVSKQVNGSVGARNSFSGPKHGGPRHRGGHGPSVSEEANGSAIWAQYVHGKDKVDGIDMGGVENAYESQFNGVVLGADFKQVGSYASGVAFNYGEGDSHSKKNVVQSDSEFDFWGVSYYGAVKKQDTNFIFDIGYSESDSDVEQKFGGNTIIANPEASTWTAGVKVEKLIDKGAVQIVPYAGLRFLTIDTDDYEAKGGTASEATYYSTERQDIWLLPVGVSFSQENVYDSGWIVTPKADLSYTWAMGDTDSSMTVNMPGVASPTTLGYTVMDDGSFMATVGLDAQKEDWTFGVAYSYQKGDSTRSDRWYVNARYSF